jgi:hypothetical protein
MTQTPSTPPTPQGPEAAKVAELEKRLADAAAEVARVQTELSQARAADPGTPQVPVPYSGQAPVVMINGQQVPAGQALDISAMLGGFFGGTPGVSTTPDGATSVVIPPVVSVNGQVVSSGQPVDLTQLVGPDVAAQIRTSISQLGLDAQIGQLFGGAAAPAASAGAPASSSPAMFNVGMASDTPGEIQQSSGRRLLAVVGAVVAGLLVAALVYLLIR